MQPHRLLLVRHAKAADGPVDVDRPLTEKGGERAAAIGRWLLKEGLVPDRALVSPALRAVQTWERATAALGSEPGPIIDARIYDNTVEALLEAVRETPEDVQTVAIVGHNPSIAELAGALDDGEGAPKALSRLEAGFGTGGVALFAVATPFAELAPGTATLSGFAVPKH